MGYETCLTPVDLRQMYKALVLTLRLLDEKNCIAVAEDKSYKKIESFLVINL